MKTATLKLETLHLVPGLQEDFNRQMESLIADCKNRPGLTKARQLSVVIDIEPHENDPDDVWIRPQLKTKRPATLIDPIRGRRTRQGQIQFDFAEEGLDEE